VAADPPGGGSSIIVSTNGAAVFGSVANLNVADSDSVSWTGSRAGNVVTVRAHSQDALDSVTARGNSTTNDIWLNNGTDTSPALRFVNDIEDEIKTNSIYSSGGVMMMDGGNWQFGAIDAYGVVAGAGGMRVNYGGSLREVWHTGNLTSPVTNEQSGLNLRYYVHVYRTNTTENAT